MKRQLSIQYENMVNFINDKKKRLRLAQIITYFRFPPKRYADILYNLYADKNDTDEMLDYVIPIITDIYFDNYELQQPKHMYCLSGIRSLDGPIYVTFKNECYTLSIYEFTNDDSQSLTDTQFQEFLNQHSKFSADMFEKMEV